MFCGTLLQGLCDKFEHLVVEDDFNLLLQLENTSSVTCAGLVPLRDLSATFSLKKLKNVVVGLSSEGKSFLVSVFAWL